MPRKENEEKQVADEAAQELTKNFEVNWDLVRANSKRRVKATLRMIESARLQEIKVHAYMPIAVREEAVEALEDFLDGLLNAGMMESYITAYDPAFIEETGWGKSTRIGSGNITKEAAKAEWGEEEDVNHFDR